MTWTQLHDKTSLETITFMDKRKSLSVIQIKERLWRLNNLKPLFSRNEELYISKEVKENVLQQRANHADQRQ